VERQQTLLLEWIGEEEKDGDVDKAVEEVLGEFQELHKAKVFF